MVPALGETVERLGIVGADAVGELSRHDVEQSIWIRRVTMRIVTAIHQHMLTANLINCL